MKKYYGCTNSSLSLANIKDEFAEYHLSTSCSYVTVLNGANHSLNFVK